MKRKSIEQLELWGGVECTYNRVGQDYMDQLELSGHQLREDDLSLFAELGIKAIRYPVLWEKTAPSGFENIDWTWTDSRLTRLKQLALKPIVGLLHHGSGPNYTRLDYESFAPGLAEFAKLVSERYPWVEYFCPVNEPLTTARFSALYGHWFPHQKSDAAFARVLVNQCRAVVLSMQNVRRTNPDAKLVQTEDFGKIYSTDSLKYQAEFENERRWLSLDLISGSLTSEMPMWHYLLSAGVTRDELQWFTENPCPPNIIGCNYYVIGERFLDDRIELYPPHMHGGNGRQSYVDIEAVRVKGLELLRWKGLLREAWDRYRLPMAVTEVHLSCHREAQVRWLLDAWNDINKIRSEGLDVRALTAWSLLGAFNWNTLVTKNVNHYESGVFELGNHVPRPTALAKTIRRLPQSKQMSPFLKHYRGWWNSSSRFLTAIDGELNINKKHNRGARSKKPTILIIGKNGTLAKAFAWACRDRRLNYVSTSRDQLNVGEYESVESFVSEIKPWAVINTAGYVRVDAAENETDACRLINTIGAKHIAEVCEAKKIQLLTFSSDLVFDGASVEPYIESDNVAPLSIYGQSKADAEQHVTKIYPNALVVRTSAFFSPWDEYNFLTVTLKQLQQKQFSNIAHDWIISPTYVPDLVHRCLDLLVDEAHGIWHLANKGALSWAEFAERGAELFGLDRSLIRRCQGESLGLRARRPKFSALGSIQGFNLPDIESSLERYKYECQTIQSTTKQFAI